MNSASKVYVGDCPRVVVTVTVLVLGRTKYVVIGAPGEIYVQFSESVDVENVRVWVWVWFEEIVFVNIEVMMELEFALFVWVCEELFV